MAYVPFSSACHDHFAFDGGLAALAPGAEQLVEVKVAVESWLVAVFAVGWFCSQPLLSLRLGFLVESDAFERGLAVIARETLGMKARACGSDNLSCDGERTALARGGGNARSAVCG